VKPRATPLPFWLLLQELLLLLLLGTLVGVGCWPLNRIDRLQDALLNRLPAFSGGGWHGQSLLVALLPLVVMPVVLLLRSGGFRDGAGSGITQVMTCLEDPTQSPRLMGVGPTLRRIGLWTLASAALFPLGREGPVVQLGAAMAQAVGRRFPALCRGLPARDVMAGAAGAGLAGGFNTPLMGTLFMAEELTGSFHARLLWPALLMGGAAALVSALGGQPLFALGELVTDTPELLQVFWAVPVGLGAGLLGAGFGRLVYEATRRLAGPVRRHPLRVGVILGLALAGLAMATGGTSGGDGERLLASALDPAVVQPRGAEWLLGLIARIAGPVLALGAGVPGGLIDPAFALGGLFGARLLDSLGADPRLGVALGMAAGLAGATQLPVMTTAFAVRMVGDQTLMPGLLAAAVLGACVSRCILSQPIYHLLAELSREPEPGGSADGPPERRARAVLPASERRSGPDAASRSEGAAAVEEDEDHGRSGQRDQGQGSEV
jgi:H+/Cl- antiporter ClcA